METTFFLLEDLIGFITGKASTAIGRKLQRNFVAAGIDITQEQWAILMVLWNKNGLNQQEICNEVFKDRPSVTRLLDNLEKYGYVERKKEKEDRRTNLIFLTEKGKNLELKAKTIAQETLNQALKNVTQAEMIVCKSVLHKVFDNLL